MTLKFHEDSIPVFSQLTFIPSALSHYAFPSPSILLGIV